MSGGDGNLALTGYISIELSNLCCYSHMHIKCPLHRQQERVILPAKIVRGLIILIVVTVDLTVRKRSRT